MKKKIDEYEQTNKMLNKIREEINNEEETEQTSDTEGGSIEPSEEELKEEKDAFKESVSSRVVFDTFKIYPNDNNVVFSGKFQGMGGISWQFTLEETDGVYINANNIQLTDNVIDILNKLSGFYKNWAEDWFEKIEDYK